MSFTPAFDALDTEHAVASDDIELVHSVRLSRAAREMLRFGGLTQDPVTGLTHFRGKPIMLTLEERELLGALLRRAGQIVSREKLAAMVGKSADAVDHAIETLRTDLKAAGVTSLPCRAEGIGYILWRC